MSNANNYPNGEEIYCVIKSKDGNVILAQYKMILYGTDSNKTMQMMNFEEQWIKNNILFSYRKDSEQSVGE